MNLPDIGAPGVNENLEGYDRVNDSVLTKRNLLAYFVH
jgi:hypothetical protein